MTEEQACLLASELASHRYWRVDEVYHPPLNSASEWCIRLQHRMNQHSFLILDGNGDPMRLVHRLNAWGQEDHP